MGGPSEAGSSGENSPSLLNPFPLRVILFAGDGGCACGAIAWPIPCNLSAYELASGPLGPPGIPD